MYLKFKLPGFEGNLKLVLNRPYSVAGLKLRNMCPECGGPVSHVSYYVCDKCKARYDQRKQLVIEREDNIPLPRREEVYTAFLRIEPESFLSMFEVTDTYYPELPDLVNKVICGLVLYVKPLKQVLILEWKDLYDANLGWLTDSKEGLVLKRLEYKFKVKKREPPKMVIDPSISKAVEKLYSILSKKKVVRKVEA